MKKRQLDLLKCPWCNAHLSLTERKTRTLTYPKEEEEKAREYCRKKKIHFSLLAHDVVEGTLKCKCRSFQIVEGIPRMTPELSKSATDVMQAKTSSSFGFQWNQFREMYPQYKQNFLNYLGKIKPSFFKAKLVLDAGCGFGRHSYYAAEFGAETVAFDLSEAVTSAQKNLEKFPLTHVVQGDIYNLPFEKKFDFIFSIGVLHHLPNPQAGFKSLVRLMNKNTSIFAWVYGKEGRWFKLTVMEGIHSLAKHLPHRLLYLFCFFPAILYQVVNLLYLFLKKIGINALAERLPFTYYAQFPFRVKHADSFDFLSTQVNNYYTKKEFEKWFTDALLKRISITDFNKKSWRGFAYRS